MMTLLMLAALQDPDPSEWNWRVGARFQLATSFGEPANDITGGSLYGSYRVAESWWLSAELYHAAFDFENPGDAVLGTSGTPTADAKIALTMFSATIEWHPLDPDSRWDFYLGAGLGIAHASDGETSAGTGVDVEVDGKFGFQIHFKTGIAFRVFDRVYLTLEGYYYGIFSKLDVEDRISGDSDSLNSWDAAGLGMGLEIRF